MVPRFLEKPRADDLFSLESNDRTGKGSACKGWDRYEIRKNTPLKKST